MCVCYVGLQQHRQNCLNGLIKIGGKTFPQLVGLLQSTLWLTVSLMLHMHLTEMAEHVTTEKTERSKSS